MLNKIRAINCSLDLYKSLRKRIEERRTNCVFTFTKFSDFDKDLDTTLIKSELKPLILRFAKGSEKNSISLALIIASQMKRILLTFVKSYLMPSKNAKDQSINRVTHLDTQLCKEIDLFTARGGRGEYLQAVYSYLVNI